MEELKNFIEENMVITTYGDYEGLADLSRMCLHELKRLTEEAIQEKERDYEI